LFCMKFLLGLFASWAFLRFLVLSVTFSLRDTIDECLSMPLRSTTPIACWYRRLVWTENI
jgi:hypothetical protein